MPRLPSVAATKNPAVDCTAVQHLLAARHLAGLPSHVAAELFRLQARARSPTRREELSASFGLFMLLGWPRQTSS
ncbi:hypothetical protein LX32DRAFT_636758 [Colletotrichum zoysiae]|uniref:Uncharacterized protein n=1 Tax=Colletotrichum zoysiae TaxID=1216348 RepID=A0AAD9HPA7_9PEZI|nr:hypothetical protein LX32DRAFT_636758 [Colletotrichum zoysiae]